MELSETETNESKRTATKNRWQLSWIGFSLGLLTIWLAIGSCYHLVATHDPLWLDERHTAWVVKGSWSELWGRAAAGNQTPLYFFLLKAMVMASGEEPGGLRFVSLSAWIVTGSLISVFLLIKTRSFIAGLSATMLLASAPWSLFYATEARPYALLVLLGMMQLLVFVCGVLRCSRSGSEQLSKWRWDAGERVCLVLLSVILVGIHPTAGLLLLAELGVGAMVFLLYRFQQKNNHPSPIFVINPWKPLVTLAVATLFAGTWLLGLRGTWDRRELWDSFTDSSLLGTQFGVGMAGASLVWVWACFDVVRHGYGKRVAAEQRHMAFLGGTMVVAVAVLAISVALIIDGVIGVPVAHQRYTLIGFVGVMAGSAWLVGGIANRWGQIVAVGLLLVINLGASPEGHWLKRFLTNFQIDQVRFEDWETAMDLIQMDPSNQPKTVLLLSNLLEDKLLNADDNRSVEQGRVSLGEYLKFPVHNIHNAETGKGNPGIDFLPLSTWGATRGQLIVQHCQAPGSATYLLIRMDETSLNTLLEEIAMVGKLHGQRISWSRLGPGRSFVQGIKLNCTAIAEGNF